MAFTKADLSLIDSFDFDHNEAYYKVKEGWNQKIVNMDLIYKNELLSEDGTRYKGYLKNGVKHGPGS